MEEWMRLKSHSGLLLYVGDKVGRKIKEKQDNDR